jgi:hypothetical protein
MEILAHHQTSRTASGDVDFRRRHGNNLVGSRRCERSLVSPSTLSRQVRLSTTSRVDYLTLQRLMPRRSLARIRRALAAPTTTQAGRLAGEGSPATCWYEDARASERRRVERSDRGLATGEADGVWRALLLMSRGFELVWGFPEAESRSQEAAHAALAIAERLDDPNLLSGCLDAVGSLLLARGRYGEYLRFGRRRIDLVPRLTDGR